MDSRVRIRWDRISVLLAAVTVLVVVIGHAIVRGVTTDAAVVAPVVAEVVPAAAPVAPPCPPAAAGALRTAPHEPGQRTVALTFDDGPGPWTDDIVAILAKEKVPATFFVIGREAAAAPKQIRKLYAAGHAVENHSWSHPSAGRRHRWSPKIIGREIRRTSKAISAISGQPPCYFRPPHGVVPGSKNQAQASGLTIALWSVDTRDWDTRGSTAADRIRKRARVGLGQPNPIVLLHDGGGDRRATVAALPGIIDDYRRRGFAFVTLADGRS